VTEYYNPPEEQEAEDEAPGPSTAQPSAPPTTSSSSDIPSASGSAPKKTFATLGDFKGGAGPSHAGHGHDDDDDDEDYEPEDDDNQNLYAGGEKSGLAVENPDDLKKKILERAKK